MQEMKASISPSRRIPVSKAELLTIKQKKRTPSPKERSAGKQRKRAEYKGSGVGLSFHTDQDAKYNERGVTSAIFTGSKEKDSSVTKSAAAEGTINITNKEKQKHDIFRLHRDAKRSLHRRMDIWQQGSGSSTAIAEIYNKKV